MLLSVSKHAEQKPRQADLEDLNSLRRSFSGADAVIHCAAYYPGAPKPLLGPTEFEIDPRVQHSRRFLPYRESPEGNSPATGPSVSFGGEALPIRSIIGRLPPALSQN